VPEFRKGASQLQAGTAIVASTFSPAFPYDQARQGPNLNRLTRSIKWRILYWRAKNLQPYEIALFKPDTACARNSAWQHNFVPNRTYADLTERLISLCRDLKAAPSPKSFQ